MVLLTLSDGDQKATHQVAVDHVVAIKVMVTEEVTETMVDTPLVPAVVAA